MIGHSLHQHLFDSTTKRVSHSAPEGQQTDLTVINSKVNPNLLHNTLESVNDDRIFSIKLRGVRYGDF